MLGPLGILEATGPKFRILEFLEFRAHLSHFGISGTVHIPMALVDRALLAFEAHLILLSWIIDFNCPLFRVLNFLLH